MDSSTAFDWRKQIKFAPPSPWQRGSPPGEREGRTWPTYVNHTPQSYPFTLLDDTECRGDHREQQDNCIDWGFQQQQHSVVNNDINNNDDNNNNMNCWHDLPVNFAAQHSMQNNVFIFVMQRPNAYGYVQCISTSDASASRLQTCYRLHTKSTTHLHSFEDNILLVAYPYHRHPVGPREFSLSNIHSNFPDCEAVPCHCQFNVYQLHGS